MKTQRILLEITYDENEAQEPSRWNWDDILDLGPDENVQIVEVDAATLLCFGKSQ